VIVRFSPPFLRVLHIFLAMSRIVLVVLMLFAVSLYAANVLNEAVVAPAHETGATSKVEPPKSVDALATGSFTMRSSSVVIRSKGGHFSADGRVDGRPIVFVVDTGASHITIRESEAARLGYQPRPRDYVVQVHTANGEGRAARIELDRVQIGDISVLDVPALVVPDAALNVNLLGMSFLSRVKWTHERGQLVLEQ
jgi:aspartyl protease family protein